MILCPAKIVLSNLRVNKFQEIKSLTIFAKVIIRYDLCPKILGHSEQFTRELERAVIYMSNLIEDERGVLDWSSNLINLRQRPLSCQAHLSAFPGFL